LLSVPVVYALAPYYFDITFFTLVSSTVEIGSMEVMLNQLRDYSRYVYPFYLLLALYIGRAAWRALAGVTVAKNDGDKPWLDVADLQAPLLPRGVDYFVVCLLCSVAIFVFVLGTNPGNYLSYLFQLVSPFLVIVVMGLLGRMGRLALVGQLLLLPAMYHAYEMQSHDFSTKHEKNWSKLQDIIDGSGQVYVSNILVERVLRSGKTIYQNAHTNYFVFTVFKPERFKRKDRAASVDAIWEAHVKRIHGMVRRREFDAILVDGWTQLPMMPPGSDYAVNGMELMERYYEKGRTLPVSAANRPGGGTFAVQVWRPRSGEIADEPPVE